MKRLITTAMLFISLAFPHKAKGDLFGGDVAVLSQILVQAIMQLAELRKILGTASDQIDLIREINRGANHALDILRTVDPNIDAGIYKDWANVQEAIQKLESVYGIVVNSPMAKVQKDTDRGIAEAVAFNNNYYKWTSQLDEIGEQLKSEAHKSSPAGAQKLTVQALGLLIQVLNQNIRAQATSLKLQAQELAIQNSKDKAETKHFLDSGSSLKQAMQMKKLVFDVPRF